MHRHNHADKYIHCYTYIYTYCLWDDVFIMTPQGLGTGMVCGSGFATLQSVHLSCEWKLTETKPRAKFGSCPPLFRLNIPSFGMRKNIGKNIAGWWCNNHLEKSEFVNGFRMTSHI